MGSTRLHAAKHDESLVDPGPVGPRRHDPGSRRSPQRVADRSATPAAPRGSVRRVRVEQPDRMPIARRRVSLGKRSFGRPGGAAHRRRSHTVMMRAARLARTRTVVRARRHPDRGGVLLGCGRIPPVHDRRGGHGRHPRTRRLRGPLGGLPPPATVRWSRASVAVWLALVVCTVGWELLAYFGTPRHDHPTLSVIADEIMSVHPGRALVFFLWLASVGSWSGPHGRCPRDLPDAHVRGLRGDPHCDRRDGSRGDA